METKAVHRYPASLKLRVVSIAVLAAIAALAFAVAPAVAKRHALIGRDGKIHGCYRVKGKPKGMLRVVRARHYHCRRGERKVSWTVVAKSGPAGATGATGAQGSPGASGAQSISETKVVEQVDALTNRVESLEATLAGVTNGDLKEAVNTLSGITNSELTEALGAVQGLTNEQLTNAVNSLPKVESLCTQTSTLTGQLNAVAGALENTALGGIIPVGLELLLPALPSELPAYSCP